MNPVLAVVLEDQIEVREKAAEVGGRVVFNGVVREDLLEEVSEQRSESE